MPIEAPTRITRVHDDDGNCSLSRDGKCRCSWLHPWRARWSRITTLHHRYFVASCEGKGFSVGFITRRRALRATESLPNTYAAKRVRDTSKLHDVLYWPLEWKANGYAYRGGHFTETKAAPEIISAP